MVNAEVDWRAKLTRILVQAGLEGIKQSALSVKMKPIMIDELRPYLYLLLERNHVQKFVLPVAGRVGIPATLWRATELIMTEDAPELQPARDESGEEQDTEYNDEPEQEE